LEDGTSRRYTWAMDAKSVVTSPSPQSPIRHGKGPLVITGLAWTGNGAITRVDVSIDGGKNWQEARLAKPGEKMALTRFYLDIEWDGGEMFLQSRAHDDTGYVQPTKDQLREVRGLNSIYHNNCIQTWWVKPNGEAENVEIS
jgi:sulfane dehydrogenase subunit SoxC